MQEVSEQGQGIALLTHLWRVWVLVLFEALQQQKRVLAVEGDLH